MLEATGERLVPEQQPGELVVAEHVARYHWVAKLVAGKRVLDAASGEGYGTAILNRAGASSVVGIDIAQEAVDHAKERYGLDYRMASVAELPLADGEIELAVSFETIEHVDDAEAVVNEFKRVLAAEGVLVISTPNKSEYTVDNEFHTREFKHAEFVELLSSRFANVQVSFQQNWLASAVGDEGSLQKDDSDSTIGFEVRKSAGVQPGRELYTIAICSDGALPDAPTNTLCLSGIHEAHEMASRIVSAEQSMWGWNERALEAERLVGEWNARASEAERQVDEWRQRALKAERWSLLYLLRLPGRVARKLAARKQSR